MRTIKWCLAILLLHAFFLSCSDTGNPALFTQIGTPAEILLREGEQVVLIPGRAQLKFRRVVEDSRCPEDAICVWAGRALIVLQLFQKSSDTIEVSLMLPGMIQGPHDGPPLDTLGYRLMLRQLNPYPKMSRPEPRQYEALIGIELLKGTPTF